VMSPVICGLAHEKYTRKWFEPFPASIRGSHVARTYTSGARQAGQR
jgi:hypothetical protein